MDSFAQLFFNGKTTQDHIYATLAPSVDRFSHLQEDEQRDFRSQLADADLNDRFGIEMGPEHRITLNRMMERLQEDTALEVAATVNTMENVRIAFDYKVEQVIQEIVDQNFDLYKRITDDPAFGDAIKNHLFDQYLHRNRGDRDSSN